MKNFVFIALIVCLLSSCGSSSTLGAIVSDGTFKRITIGKKPPTQVTDTLHLANVNTSRVKAVSISPNGLFSLLWSRDSSPQYDIIKIYNSLNGNLEFNWDESNIRSLIKNNTDGNYDEKARFMVRSLRWKTEDSLIIDVQIDISNTRTENSANNVSIVFNLRSKRVVETGLYPPEQLPRIQEGSFPNRDIYSRTTNNGNLLINGNIVQGVPGYVSFADITTLKK